MTEKKPEIKKPYEFKEFPKWKYKKGSDGALQSRLVVSPAHETKLGEEWGQSPKDAMNKETYDAVDFFEECDESPEALDAEMEVQANGIVKKRGRPFKA